MLKQPAHFDYAPILPNDKDQLRFLSLRGFRCLCKPFRAWGPSFGTFGFVGCLTGVCRGSKAEDPRPRTIPGFMRSRSDQDSAQESMC